MADREDLEFTYSLIDRIFRLSLGELADFSGAKYDGDFSLSLEEAQRRKHDYVAEQIGIGPGRRVLDLGCGWGPLLDFVREPRRRPGSASRCPRRRSRRAGATGSTSTSPTRGRSTRESFGAFDAVASLGAFEHFCSPEEYRAGRQDEIYRDLFARVASVLPDSGRLLPADDGVRAEHDPGRRGRHRRAARLRRLVPRAMGRQFPGSWLPLGPGAGHRAAPSRTSAWCRARAGASTTSRPSASGARRFAAPSLRKTLLKLRLVPRWLDERRLPARVHLGRERQQRLLRAGAARPLSARVREDGIAEPLAPRAKVTSRPRSSSQSFSRTARTPSRSDSVGTAWKTGFSSCARCRL